MPRGGKKNGGDLQQSHIDVPPGLESTFQSQQQNQNIVPSGVPHQLDMPPPVILYDQPPPGLESRFQHPPPMPNNQNNQNNRQHRSEPQRKQKPPFKLVSGSNAIPVNRERATQAAPSSKQNRENQGSTDECILCCQRSGVFGVGQCRHPACVECVIRMRCLGESTKCHFCRDDIEELYFVRTPSSWNDYKIPDCHSNHPDCKKFNICFEDQYAVDLYNTLNANSCNVCTRKGAFGDFPTFPALKQHIGAEHGLYFCHICLEHLNILPKKRQTFTNKELQLHMTGQKNVVQGVRGHPSCGFCNVRLFDGEELYKHSRKEHFYCGLCAETSGMNSFFKHVNQLHNHYKKEHHPCLNSECVEMGIVFSNEFELNVHKTERHGGNDRKIPIEFQFSRNQSRYDEPSSRLVRAEQNQGISIVPSRQAQQPANIIPSAQFTNRTVNLVPRPNIAQQHDFPTLSSSNAPNSYNQSSNWRADVNAARHKVTPKVESTLQDQIGSASHFPTLGGPSSSRSSATKSNVWNNGNAVDVIKKAPQKQVQSSPKPQRKKVIPLPDIWPEHMQRKLEAKAAGLPEPADLDPQIAPTPVEFISKQKKEKKPKKKMVGLETLKKRLNDQAPITESAPTKFNVLSEMD